MQMVKVYLQEAQDALVLNGDWNAARSYLKAALDQARMMKCDVPRNRCLRAYIAQAIGALQLKPDDGSQDGGDWMYGDNNANT